MKPYIYGTIIVGLLLALLVYLIMSSFNQMLHTKIPSIHNNYQAQLTQVSDSE